MEQLLFLSNIGKNIQILKRKSTEYQSDSVIVKI